MQSGPMGHPFVYDKSDTFDFFMNIIPLSLVNQKYFTEPNDRKPLWDELINNPNYNEHWQKRDLTQYLPKSNTVCSEPLPSPPLPHGPLALIQHVFVTCNHGLGILEIELPSLVSPRLLHLVIQFHHPPSCPAFLTSRNNDLVRLPLC